MSLKSWKEEFYPVSAKRCGGSDLKRVQHSLQKWRGLTKANLQKHGVKYCGGDIVEDVYKDCNWEETLFYVDATSCALCVKYLNRGGGCEGCPLVLVRRGGEPCDRPYERSPYSKWEEEGKAQPMISLLEKAERMLMEGEEK
jgi:hypothetical protein